MKAPFPFPENWATHARHVAMRATRSSTNFPTHGARRCRTSRSQVCSRPGIRAAAEKLKSPMAMRDSNRPQHMTGGSHALRSIQLPLPAIQEGMPAATPGLRSGVGTLSSQCAVNGARHVMVPHPAPACRSNVGQGRHRWPASTLLIVAARHIGHNRRPDPPR